MDSQILAVVISGIVGTSICFGLIFWFIYRKSTNIEKRGIVSNNFAIEIDDNLSDKLKEWDQITSSLYFSINNNIVVNQEIKDKLEKLKEFNNFFKNDNVTIGLNAYSAQEVRKVIQTKLIERQQLISLVNEYISSNEKHI